MSRLSWRFLPVLLAATPAAAQQMPDMTMPMPMPVAPTDSAPVEAAPGDGPPPAAPDDHAADGVYDPMAMAHARAMLHADHGGMAFHQILFNLAEVQLRHGRDAYRWDGEGWFGGDINRLVVKSEGGGGFGSAAQEAEVQALYSHAIGPYFDLQGGVRQDLAAGPRRPSATIGVEGLAPYWFEVEARLFLTSRGDLLGRIETWYDARVTQRLVLQPRAELNFAAQSVAERKIGSGLSDAELGLRLRYEFAREFAPYVGLSWQRQVGASARYSRDAGQRASATSLVMGTRVWF